jgi:hypothetical protein
MQKLNIPAYPFKSREYKGKQQIFDSIRRKYVALTSEEWVRQNFIQWLIHDKNYPPGLIAIEKELTLNDLKKRFDIVVYNKNHVPSLLIECKAPEIKISQKSFDQAGRYNLTLKVSYLVITNGLEHYCCHIDIEKGAYSFIEHIPDFDNLF